MSKVTGLKRVAVIAVVTATGSILPVAAGFSSYAAHANECVYTDVNDGAPLDSGHHSGSCSKDGKGETSNGSSTAFMICTGPGGDNADSPNTTEKPDWQDNSSDGQKDDAIILSEENNADGTNNGLVDLTGTGHDVEIWSTGFPSGIASGNSRGEVTVDEWGFQSPASHGIVNQTDGRNPC